MKTRRQQRGVLNHSPAGAGAGGHPQDQRGNTHCHSAAGAICACKGSGGVVIARLKSVIQEGAFVSHHTWLRPMKSTPIVT